MSIATILKKHAETALETLYQFVPKPTDVVISQTKPEFEGDYTIVLFPFVKQLKKSPDALGQEIGDWLKKNTNGLFSSFNIIKGFLNISVSNKYWIQFLEKENNNKLFGYSPANGQKVMIEYSSPNTNKPLHLGHLRNNFLGWSVAEIYKANGFEVVKTCIANDRGIHICKSMVAWQLFANGATPESTGTKGDHLVGEYYVKFGDELKNQVADLIEKGISKDEAEKEAPIMKAAQQMLVDWEAGKPDVIELWQKMNSWVYEGFAETYKRIGSDFDKTYYESNVYLSGKKMVEDGLAKGIFYEKEDTSVWIDLTGDGLDQKIVRRSDGTAVYMTQDIGLAEIKQQDFNADKSIYVVGDEQNYHFKVLKLICEKLGLPAAEGIYHLSYGMVELPTGRMKTREGTVVDADEICDEMENVAKVKTEELGKTDGFTAEELIILYHTIGMGALKFFLLRVDAKKKMMFNPEESIDFHGFTGPFIQYTHARIKSILKKTGEPITNYELGITNETAHELYKLEKELIVLMEQFPIIINQTCAELNPSLIAIYVFNLAKTFSSFYSEHSIANAESEEKKQLRLVISSMTANVISNGMQLLGIEVPERM